MSELEAILNGEPEQTIEPEAVVEDVEPVEEVEQERPTGEEESAASESATDDESSTPEPEKPNDTPNWQFEAYKDEKRKRQDLENKYSELEKRLESLQNPKKEEQQEIPDVFEDQNTYTDYIKGQIDQTALSVRAEMSQFMAEREFGKDVVAEKLEAFREMAKLDQNLTTKVLGSTSPVHEAIEIVNKAEKLKQLENVEDFESKVRAEIEEKVRKELEAKFSESQSKRSSVTPSLNTKASSTQTEAVESLADILGGR